jgi:predicted Rossmann fold flavoprotein
MHGHLYDAIVLGAGAAGLFCAANAGLQGASVLVLEHNAECGRKILISGGGRCNFTNIGCRPENFLSRNAHFARSALARYTPQDFLELLARHKIAWYEKTLGQLFCQNSARDITEMLLRECSAGGVRILTSTQVLSIRHDGSCYLIETSAGQFRCNSLVVATGGLSIPKIGATRFGYDLARQFGHRLIPDRPALVPLTFSPTDLTNFADLSGLSLAVTASVSRAGFREKMLFTHRGLSGPAILQISSYWHKGELLLDLAPDADLAKAWLLRKAQGDRSAWKTLLAEHWPQRLAERWTELYQLEQPLLRMSDKAIAAEAERVHSWRVQPAGTEGYAKAEVTAGGVDTNELSSQTMESKLQPGLFFIGEVVDVTGWLGGYNFQWAWASAMAAAQAVMRRSVS